MTTAYIRDTDGKLTDVTLNEYIDSYGELSDVDISSQDLRDYNFYSLNLSNSNLSNCDLENVDLENADLRGTNLTGTDLTGTDLRDIVTDDYTHLPYDIILIGEHVFEDCRAWDCRAWDVVITPHEMRIGCQCHSIKDWENAPDEWIDMIDRDALKFWKKYGEKLLTIAKDLRNNPNPQPHVTVFNELT